jgi:hypothetical protein
MGTDLNARGERKKKGETGDLGARSEGLEGSQAGSLLVPQLARASITGGAAGEKEQEKGN